MFIFYLTNVAIIVTMIPLFSGYHCMLPLAEKLDSFDELKKLSNLRNKPIILIPGIRLLVFRNTLQGIDYWYLGILYQE